MMVSMILVKIRIVSFGEGNFWTEIMVIFRVISKLPICLLSFALFCFLKRFELFLQIPVHASIQITLSFSPHSSLISHEEAKLHTRRIIIITKHRIVFTVFFLNRDVRIVIITGELERRD